MQPQPTYLQQAPATLQAEPAALQAAPLPTQPVYRPLVIAAPSGEAVGQPSRARGGRRYSNKGA